MRIKLGGLGVVFGLAVAIVACGEDDPPAKQPLVVCQAGENGCPSDKPANQKKQNPSTTTTSGGPTELPADKSEDPPPSSASNADAGGAVDSGPPAPGPICTKLKACCKQLEDAGYSPATCLEIVNTRSENACSLQHKQYRDFGDCS